MSTSSIIRPLRHTFLSRLPRPITSCSSSRFYTASCRLRSSDSNNNNNRLFRQGPAPPRLPEAEQKIFEDLQRRSTGAFSTPREAVKDEVAAADDRIVEIEAEADLVPNRSRARPVVNQPGGTDADGHTKPLPEVNARVTAQGKGDELHPDVRRGASPEFQGDRNPQTGEVGGPKNNPLRWGGEADWSFNGRVTDF